MRKILKNPANIVTVNTNGKNYKRGHELNDINLLHNHSIVIEDDLIKDIIPTSKLSEADEIIDVTDKTILPGLVESHTHLIFAGSRANEFVMKLKGSTYEEIALAGGGIMNTVRAVRTSTKEQLLQLSAPKVQNFISQGITTLEIKSGYGLDFENEVKMLETIKDIKSKFSINIVATFLGAHTFPPEYKTNREPFISLITEKIIPFISENRLASFCDAFCETTAFLPEEAERIFLKAKEYGLGLKVHTDQFNSIGGVDLSLRLKAASIDHLEVLPDTYYEELGNSETVCTLLPGVSFFLNYRFAPARGLIDNNAIVSLASDYNPGSSNINNIFLVMSLAAIKMKMSVNEIVSAYTINAAKSLNLSNSIGSIEIGKKADFAVFDISDLNDLVYNIGQNPNLLTIKNGEIIWKKEEGLI